MVEDGKPLYGNKLGPVSAVQQYLNHHLKLHPSFDFYKKLKINKELKKTSQYYSGICHHIIYNKKIIEEIISLVENKHNVCFWKYYLNCVNTKSRGLREGRQLWCQPANCELYYNYVNLFHPDKIKIRKITWLESGASEKKQNNIVINYDTIFKNKRKIALSQGHNYIAFHSYNREYYKS